MDDIGAEVRSRPTVGQMIVRDVHLLGFGSVPVMIAVLLLFMSSIEYEDPSEAVDLTGLYLLLAVDSVIGLYVVYWRWGIYTSILQSGVETPGEVTSVVQAGDSVFVVWTYRWQAETIKSGKVVGGFIPKRRLKYQVGLKATLLVDPNKPKRFIILDSIR